MRIRTIKPEFWQNEKIAALDDFTQLLAIGLLNYADDEGYFNANKNLIRAAVFPLRERSCNISESVTKLANQGFVKLYQCTDGRIYGNIVNFHKHQVINRPNPSKIKALDLISENSVKDQLLLTEESMPEGNREQGKEQGKVLLVPAKPARARDVLFDALATAEGSNPNQLTKGAAQSIGVALAEIRKACPNLTANEIQARAQRYARVMPQGSTLTAQALAKHWARCDTQLARFNTTLQAPAADGPKGWRETLNRIRPGNLFEGAWNTLPESMRKEIHAEHSIG